MEHFSNPPIKVASPTLRQIELARYFLPKTRYHMLNVTTRQHQQTSASFIGEGTVVVTGSDTRWLV